MAVGGICNSVPTNTGMLTVNTNIDQPTLKALSVTNQTLCPGVNSATLTATASGTGPFTYQWSLNGTVLAAQTTSSIIIVGASQVDAGTYDGGGDGGREQRDQQRFRDGEHQRRRPRR